MNQSWSQNLVTNISLEAIFFHRTKSSCQVKNWVKLRLIALVMHLQLPNTWDISLTRWCNWFMESQILTKKLNMMMTLTVHLSSWQGTLHPKSMVKLKIYLRVLRTTGHKSSRVWRISLVKFPVKLMRSKKNKDRWHSCCTRWRMELLCKSALFYCCLDRRLVWLSFQLFWKSTLVSQLPRLS